jgi:hypothetical protein
MPSPDNQIGQPTLSPKATRTTKVCAQGAGRKHNMYESRVILIDGLMHAHWSKR